MHPAATKRARVDVQERAALVRATTTQLAQAFLQQRFLVVGAILAGETIKRLPGMETKTLNIVARLRDAIAQPVTVAVRSALNLGMQRTERDLVTSLTFTLRNRVAEDYLSTVAAERITGITVHTRDVVRSVLEQGIAAGNTPRELAEAVYRQAGGGGIFSRARAEMIARTEVGEAYVQANLETSRTMGNALGLTQEKRWLTGGDPCAICAQAAADGWIGMDAAFSNGEDSPLPHPNCKCDLEYRVVNPSD